MTMIITYYHHHSRKQIFSNLTASLSLVGIPTKKKDDSLFYGISCNIGIKNLYLCDIVCYSIDKRKIGKGNCIGKYTQTKRHTRHTSQRSVCDKT